MLTLGNGLKRPSPAISFHDMLLSPQGVFPTQVCQVCGSVFSYKQLWFLISIRCSQLLVIVIKLTVAHKKCNTIFFDIVAYSFPSDKNANRY